MVYTVRHRSLISFIWEYLTMSKRFPVTFLGLTCAPLTCAAGRAETARSGIVSQALAAPTLFRRSYSSGYSMESVAFHDTSFSYILDSTILRCYTAVGLGNTAR